MKRKLWYGGSMALAVVAAVCIFFAASNRPDANIRSEKEGKLRPDQPDMFAKALLELKTEDGELKPRYEPNYLIDEMKKAGVWGNRLSKAKGDTLNWVERGPGNLSGRSRALVIDIAKDATGATWYAGSVGGGIWKTTNSGALWTNLTPTMANMAITALVKVDTVMYAGTGEGGFGNLDGINGNGVFKSTNSGANWTQLAFTAGNAEFKNINRMIAHPTNANIVLAATTTGLFKSTDGGTTWATIDDLHGGNTQHIIANPSNWNTMYAGLNGFGAFKSVDAGNTWTDINSGLGQGSRFELAIAPTDTNILYASIEGSVLYKSGNAGTSWTRLDEISGAAPDYHNGQGWYDNVIQVNPYNPNKFFVGGVNIWSVDMQLGGGVAIDAAATTSNTSYFGFVNFGQPYLSGGGNTGKGFWGVTSGITALEDTMDIRFLFGPGLSQLGYRYVNIGAANFAYQYGDGTAGGGPKAFVKVPFQAWNLSTGQQISVAFRDQDNDGEWNLKSAPTGGVSREYTSANNVVYSTTPDANMAVQGGNRYKSLFVMTPLLSAAGITSFGTSLDTNDAIPTSNVTLAYNPVPTFFRETKQMTNWFEGQSDGNGGTRPFVHADQHNLILVKQNDATKSFKMFAANDGGVAHSTTSGLTWVFDETTMDGFNTTQLYGADKKPGESQYIIGLQDNGTWLSKTGKTANEADAAWTDQLGGDGFDVVWHAKKPLSIMGSIYYNAIRRTTNGGTSWETVTSGLPNGSGFGPFVTAIGSSKQNPDLLIALANTGPYRSDNFGTTWAASVNSGTAVGFTNAPRIEISKKNPNIIWVGANHNGNRIAVSTNAGFNFAATSAYTVATLGNVSGLGSSPSLDSVGYACFSLSGKPHIIRSTNLGATWSDISGFGASATSNNGYPNVATYGVIELNFPKVQRIWAATEIGIIQSVDSGRTWAARTDFPAVAIWNMRVAEKEVVMATHGRGTWSVRIDSLPALASATLPPTIVSGTQEAPPKAGDLVVTVSYPQAFDSATYTLWSRGVAGLNVTTKVTAPAAGNATFRQTVLVSSSDTINLSAWKGGVKYQATQSIIGVTKFKDPVRQLFHSFDSDTSGWTVTAAGKVGGLSFKSITTTPGGATTLFSGVKKDAPFADSNLTTVHPYANSTDYYTQLTQPVYVSATTSKITFKEIALLEPADAGAAFGTAEFWDYAIVQGSTDLVTWKNLSDGWNSRDTPAWATAWVNGGALNNVTTSLFRTRSIDMITTFPAGSIVFLRFYLFADAGANGQGWWIDSLSVNPSYIVPPGEGGPAPVVDKTAPILKLYVFGNPLANKIIFNAGADEPKTKNASLTINGAAQTLTAAGNYYSATYNLSASSMDVKFNLTDSADNVGKQLNPLYVVGKLSKTVVGNYTISGKGSGNVVAAKGIAIENVPENFLQVGEALNVVAGEAVFSATYGDLVEQVRAQVGAEFEEAKVGLYSYENSKWNYVGGEGLNGAVSAKGNVNILGVFYNPEHVYVPKEFALEQNYPNPFNPTTTIKYEVPAAAKVVIKVYNMLGQEVRTLVNENKNVGKFGVNWDGKNNLGTQVASGVYLYRLEAGNFVKARKMLLIK